VISIFLLLPLYAIAIQYERGGGWRVCYVVAVPVLLLDVVLNYTELVAMTLDRPRWGEWTFSTRLKRLKRSTGWRGDAGRYVARVLDAIAPTGKHVED
jgi:hypothetical protein